MHIIYFSKQLTAVADIGGIVETGRGAVVGVDVRDTEEPPRFDDAPCFINICFL